MKHIWILAVTLLFAAVLTYLIASGDLTFGQPAMADMDEYYLANGVAETGANNIVTSIVFDYRGFDTLGEATVLFAAVLGVGSLFRKLNKEEEEAE
jgi:multisubunit Na+/H+ antiporter MnhB subunit